MAITIIKYPLDSNGSDPQVSKAPLIWSISSSNVPQFQFRYIADLFESGSSTRLARFKYPQNTSGTANIDLSRPINDYMETDYNWAISGSQIYSASLTTKRFNIQFGEEYGISYDSAVTVFPNQAEAQQSVLKGNVQYPTPSNFDGSTGKVTLATSSLQFNPLPYSWGPSQPYNQDIVEYSDGTLTNNANMLNSPATSKYYKEQNVFSGSMTSTTLQTVYDSGSIGWYVAQPIGHTDLGTETYYSEFFSAGSYVFTRQVRVFDDNNNQIGGDSNTYVTEATNLDKQALLSFPVGMEQMGALTAGGTPLSASISSSNQWSWYQSSVRKLGDNFQGFNHYYYNEDKGPDTLFAKDTRNVGTSVRPGLWANKFYPSYCNGEKTRFAFNNSFGCWDYYNVYMPTRRSTKVNRKTYEQESINLNDRIYQYNVSNRGELQYYTEYTDQFEITTDIIDAQESRWLGEMFRSTDVFIQSGSNFIPINILNKKETIINTTARNKNYQYTLKYQFSNLREPR